MLFIFLSFFSFTLFGETKGFLTSEEIALFFKQGYFLKSRCLNKSVTAQLDNHTSALIEKAIREIEKSQFPFSEEDQFLFIEGSRVVFKKRLGDRPSILRINGCGGMCSSLLSTLCSEKMIHTFFELLGTNDLEHLISQFHPKLPQDGVSYPKHRDIQFRRSFDPEWVDILRNGSYAICIIPVDPMNPENGGLWIDRNNYPAEHIGLEEDILWLNAEPGDLLFIHPYLFHGSGPNLAENTSRRTLLTGFCAFGANRKSYPGAYVNRRFTLTEGEISISLSPWATYSVESDANH